jgi:pyruvate kinase
MVATKQPSRAEVNDVISTLNMGTSGLVLAAETAIGKYPVECVEMISRLIRQYEYWTPNTSIQ